MGCPTSPENGADPPVAPARITIADAIKVYLGNRETANVAPATLRTYRTFTKKPRAFCDSRGYIVLDQFTATDMDVFYPGLPMWSWYPPPENRRRALIFVGSDARNPAAEVTPCG